MSIFGSVFQNHSTGRFYSTQPLREIRKYTHQDLEQVRQIALENMPKLVSIDPPFHKDQRSQLFESQIKPLLESSDAFCKVVRCNGQTVGFTNYSSTLRWSGMYGSIRHLAIDSRYQKSGGGSMLLQHAIEELRARKVNVVHLSITDEDAINFYR